MPDIVQQLWGFCHTLRHDGVDYGDYIEQITYLLFLKMADERGIDLSSQSYRTEQGRTITVDCSWAALAAQSGTRLTVHYACVPTALGRQRSMLGDIYAKAQARFKNAVNLKRLINLIAETEWTSLEVDVKAHAYEGLLEKAASEGKKGAGQYFTPRVLITIHPPLHEARPASRCHVHRLRFGLRHRRLPRGCVRAADGDHGRQVSRRGVGQGERRECPQMHTDRHR